jgi:hypothetical protein
MSKRARAVPMTFAFMALGAFLATPALAETDFLIPLRVIDATGKVVGRFDGGRGVFMNFDGRKVDVLLSRISEKNAGLTWGYNANIYGTLFESSDCSGPADVEMFYSNMAEGFGTVASMQLAGPGIDTPKIYLGHGLMAKLKEGPWHSRIGDGGCIPGEIQGPMKVWELDAPIDLGPLFTTPFHIE